MKLKWIDLSHELHSDIPTWEGSCGFHSKIREDYDSLFRVMEYSMFAGAGTHLDAPSHLIPGAADVASLGLNQLICPAHVIDVTEQVRKDPSYFVSLADILNYEKSYQQIQPNSFVIAHTGWDQRWDQPPQYRNEIQGQLKFPGFSPEVADLLLERGIAGIGIDTLSPDGSNMEFPVHYKILGAGKVILENLTQLQSLPPVGSFILALPLKIKGGTESPIRAIALIP